MNFASKVMIFISVWWVVVFLILPFKVSVPVTQEKGHADSAPIAPMIGIKLIITSVISLFVTWIIVLMIKNGFLSRFYS